MRRTFDVGLAFLLASVIGCVALPTTRSEPASSSAAPAASSG
jgi:hypothetical protein